MSGETESRSITDADAEAIAVALQARVTKQFYEDLGKGVWGWVWRGIVAGAFAFAAFSGLKGLK
jgi:hypothetical protein